MPQFNFEDVRKVYFIGIGGIGVSAVARMFVLRGAEVSGSDIARSPITSELEGLGVRIFYEQNGDNISENCDLVIHTIAIPDNNPELLRAREAGIVTMTYPEVLGLISRSHETVAVAGTHGKTTTTAMLAEALIAADVDPTVIVGSLLKNHQSNFIPGNSESLLVEACEYRESFHHLSPDVLVITNIEEDHLDFYRDLDHIIESFNVVVKKVPSSGTIVADVNNSNVSRALQGALAQVVDYEKFIGEVEVAVPGEHNRQNAAAAYAAAMALGADAEKVKESLKKFSGTWRRFEKKGQTPGGALVYDDYAHHPTEIRATLAGAREAFPDKKVVAVFQPHLFSRTKELLGEFSESFSHADEVLVLPIYASREKFDASISSEMLVQATAVNHGSVRTARSFEEVSLRLRDYGEESVIFTLGAGDVYKVSDSLVC